MFQRESVCWKSRLPGGVRGEGVESTVGIRRLQTVGILIHRILRSSPKLHLLPGYRFRFKYEGFERRPRVIRGRFHGGAFLLFRRRARRHLRSFRYPEELSFFWWGGE